MKRAAAPLLAGALFLTASLSFAGCSSADAPVATDPVPTETVDQTEAAGQPVSIPPLDQPTVPDTATQPTVADTSDPVGQPEGFTTAVVEITEANGEVCEVCVWLADSADERGQGLMGVTSLGTAKGMAFVWDQPSAGSFYMFHTVTPLSIAWFGADGALVSTADMEPCVGDDSAVCERFPAGGDYVLAIEVFQGDLASIGITDGATARLLPGSEALDCPLA